VRDLSLHLLDLIENSLRAGASIIEITVEADDPRDLLAITVEDNGRGLTVPPEFLTDPFYTTKGGKKVGLGLALWKAAAERAGGSLVIGRGGLGGVAVKAIMGLTHIDRSPLGDLSETLASVVCTNPEVDFRVAVKRGDFAVRVSSTDLSAGLPDGADDALSLAREMAENVRKAQQNLTL
jgi:hypothetical protein